MTAGLSLKRAANNQHFIIYLDLNGLLEKIVTNLKPLASISLEHAANRAVVKFWAIQIPNLDIPVALTPVIQNGTNTELTGNSDIRSLAPSIFGDDNLHRHSSQHCAG